MLQKLFFIFNRKDRVKIFFLMLAILLGSGLELLAVSAFSPFIEIMLNPSELQNNSIFKRILEWFPGVTVNDFLILLCCGIIVIYIVKNIYIIVQKNLIYRFSYGTQQRISTNLLKAYMSEPYTFHLNKNIAELQRSMLEDTDQFMKACIHLMELVAEVIVCVTIGVYLFIVSKSVTTIVGGLLILCVGAFSYISKRYSTAWGRQSQHHMAKIYQWMNQSLGGIKEIKVLNREESFIKQYDHYFGKYTRVLRLGRLMGVVPKYIIEMVSMTGLLSAILFKICFGQDNLAEFVPQLAIFAVAAFRLLPSVGRINEHLSNTLYAAPSLDLIYNDLKEIEGLKNQHQPKDEQWRFENCLEVKNVHYAYPDGDSNVIEDASFVIEKGTTVAFVGASGAGKSTMVDILLGLLEPQKGVILADGMDIYQNLPTWQKEIGYIPQSIYLSDDTIRNNVALGVDESEIDDAAIIKALKQAQLYEFVESLPNGLDTFVGDRGVRLSGGQRQRIGIARALYHDPEILVLDEATSALDNDTEMAVMEAIDSLQNQKTILIIAHRLTTLRNVDTIYEVTDGKVVHRDKKDILGE